MNGGDPKGLDPQVTTSIRTRAHYHSLLGQMGSVAIKLASALTSKPQQDGWVDFLLDVCVVGSGLVVRVGSQYQVWRHSLHKQVREL